MSCNTCNPCEEPICSCAVEIDAKCVTVTGEFECSSIESGLSLNQFLEELDAFICTKFNELAGYFALVNVGNGAEIYAGINGIGQKKIRTILGSDTITVTEGTDTITLEADFSGLEQPPLQSIDQGSGTGIIIRGRLDDNYLPVGNKAVDLSYSGNAFPLSGASGTYSFTANSKTTATATDSAAFNSAIVSEQGSFAVNQSINSGFYAFSWGSGDARGTNSMAGGVSCIAEQQGSTATGTSTQATGFSSDAIGQETQALAPLSSASGHLSKTRGNASHAGGQNNETDSHGETAIGTYGTIQAGNPSDIAFIPTDRLFNVGNGFINPSTSVITRSDALTLLKNGLLTLPSVTNTLISAASGKAVVTKEYLVSQLPIIDGSETKINPGTNISITGNGTIATPYIINNTLTVDGSETKLNSGTTTTVTGNGTVANPYIVEVVATSVQKVITYPGDFTGTNYTLSSTDNNKLIFVVNGSSNVTITVPTGLPNEFFAAFIQEGTADVSFTGSGTTINTATGSGFKIKGQNSQVALDKKGSTTSFWLTGNTKV